MLTTDRAAGGALCLLALFVLWESRTLPLGTLRNPGPAYTPVLLAAALLILGALVVAMGGRSVAITAVGWGESPRALLVLGVSAFIALALERLGYRLTILVALLFLVWLVERRSFALAAVFALGMAFGSFYLFDTLLRVPLPRGPWGV